MKFVVICELKWDEDRIEFWIGFVVEFMEVRDSHSLISMICVQIPIIKIHYFFTLYLWRSWSWGLIILKHGHWAVGKWFCLFSSIVEVSFIFYQKSKPCISRLTNVFKVLFLFFTIQLFAIFFSNSFPFSYYLHFSF